VTDSVLSALLPQLNAPFDRTLLLVIADRADEVCGDGEGWRVLHQLGREPAHWRHFSDWWYWAPGYDGGYLDEGFLLPPHWYEATLAESYYTGEDGELADFTCVQEAFEGAATAWLLLTEDQKQLSLEAFE